MEMKRLIKRNVVNRMEYFLAGGTGTKFHRTYRVHCIFPKSCHLECDGLTAESQTACFVLSWWYYPRANVTRSMVWFSKDTGHVMVSNHTREKHLLGIATLSYVRLHSQPSDSCRVPSVKWISAARFTNRPQMKLLALSPAGSLNRFHLTALPLCSLWLCSYRTGCGNRGCHSEY